MAVIEAKDVEFHYYSSRSVLKDINMEFEEGKMYAIVGPSGCGKTTLLSLLGGLDVPTGGEILCVGKNISQLGLEKHRRDNVTFIFQSYNLIDYMTAAENVTLTSKEDPFPILEKLGITKDEATRNVLKLSGGQQQRVAIARALASNASIILADEPTGNLDEETAGEITKILKESAHTYGKCVIVVTHSNELASEADQVFRLRGGILLKEELVCEC
ncbi:ABC transporter ATP-binding protein [Anaerosacchariphilus polymeriproducens]|uniref:ABC transporter ATP-binding protein n=1 Tax=Anaerosacchariphilus polymeriproducens TaxID=1812858 RepID=A0A371AWH7_9FIRM|nr:ABC transporter ATP-binding protein [Anaerosacchariphilus polymeriproducens]RDU23820.1 ABC transporter ATP-binding protein [Anaerosacchariphilus polymeriproducens]